MSTLQSRLAADAELNRLVAIGAEDPLRLSPAARIRFAWAMYELLGAAEFMYHQACSAALPPEVWVRWQATLVWWMSNPGIRTWWEAKPAPLTADFEAFLNDVVRADSMDEATLDRWRAFVAGEDRETYFTRGSRSAGLPSKKSNGRSSNECHATGMTGQSSERTT
jgi:hypothetical protein